jgi:fatty acid desaturase
MTNETKKTLKYRLWQFFGSMFMEQKNGSQAVSLHRVLAAVLFFACMILWFWVDRDVPQSMLYTLWGLLGINGASKVAGVFKTAPSGVTVNSIADTTSTR